MLFPFDELFLTLDRLRDKVMFRGRLEVLHLESFTSSSSSLFALPCVNIGLNNAIFYL